MNIFRFCQLDQPFISLCHDDSEDRSTILQYFNISSCLTYSCVPFFFFFFFFLNLIDLFIFKIV